MSIRLDTGDTEWHTALIVWKVTLLCSEDRLTIFLFILHLVGLLPLKNKLQNHKTFLDLTRFLSIYCSLSPLFLSPVSWESLFACLHHLTSHLLDEVYPGLRSSLHQQSCPSLPVTNMFWIRWSCLSPYLTWPLLSTRMWDSVTTWSSKHVFLGSRNLTFSWFSLNLFLHSSQATNGLCSYGFSYHL